LDKSQLRTDATSSQMSIVRRSLAACSSVLLLNLTLLGSGTLCAAKHGTEHGAVVESAMSGMSSGTMATSSSSTPTVLDAEHPVTPEDCDAPPQHGGCQLPSAPGQCTSMTTCSTPAALIGATVASEVAQAFTLALPEPLDIHSGPPTAPELPPPRA